MNLNQNKLVTMERKGKVIKAVIRQMDHDVKAIVGKKYKYCSGPMWMVLAVEESSW